MRNCAALCRAPRQADARVTQLPRHSVHFPGAVAAAAQMLMMASMAMGGIDGLAANLKPMLAEFGREVVTLVCSSGIARWQREGVGWRGRASAVSSVPPIA